MRNKLLFLSIIIITFTLQLKAQNPIEIGTLNSANEELLLSGKNKSALRIAYIRTFNDGRKLDSVWVENVGGRKFLLMAGTRMNVKSLTAVSISIINNKVYVENTTEVKTCANGSCTACSFFVEHNKVVACKCESTGTVSNHCTFKVNDAVVFYTVLSKLNTGQ
ncbi:MAG: hypothetical protein V4643_07270 [Bacteroidota bacterium]